MRLKLAAYGLLIALAVTGCGGAQTKCNDPDGSAVPPASQTAQCGETAPAAQISEVTFEVVAEDKLPSELAGWKAANAGQTQVSGGSLASQRLGDQLYVAVHGGEQPTGGYRVEVGKVKLAAEAQRDLLSIEARVTPPSAGTGTTQAISYPRVYIRIPYEAAKRAPVVQGVVTVQAAGTGSVQAPGTVAAQPATPQPATPAQPPAAGSAPQQPPTSLPKTETAPATKPQPSGGAVQFQAVDSRQLPPALQSWSSATRGDAGVTAQAVEGVLYVMVEAGEQRTGGYRVEIRKVELVGADVKVQAVLHRPAPGAMVTQAITYPKAFAKVAYDGAGPTKAQVEWVR